MSETSTHLGKYEMLEEIGRGLSGGVCDLHDAQRYCAWVDGRLRTEAEWEYTAQGEDGRTYLWGDDPPSHRSPRRPRANQPRQYNRVVLCRVTRGLRR